MTTENPIHLDQASGAPRPKVNSARVHADDFSQTIGVGPEHRLRKELADKSSGVTVPQLEEPAVMGEKGRALKRMQPGNDFDVLNTGRRDFPANLSKMDVPLGQKAALVLPHLL